MNLSDHFTLEEAIASETAERNGINNIPDSDTIRVMQKTADKMEKVRALLGDSPLHINSWYRCPILNMKIGSQSTSQHLKGEAVDFICPKFGSPLAICKQIIEYKALIPFDQLILEHTWVHISFAILNGNPRGHVLSLLTNKKYAAGLTDLNGNPL